MDEGITGRKNGEKRIELRLWKVGRRRRKEEIKGRRKRKKQKKQ